VSKFYDVLGNVTSIQDPILGVVNQTYDTLENFIGYSNSWGSMSYSYDNLGRRTGIQDPDGNVTGYYYDAIGRPYLIQNYAKNQWTQYAYDSIGRKTLEIYPNGVFTQYGYETCACPNKVLSTVIYQPTDNFNRTSIGSNWNPSGSWSISQGKLVSSGGTNNLNLYSTAGNLTISRLESTIIPTNANASQDGYMIYGYRDNGKSNIWKYAGYDLAAGRLVLGHGDDNTMVNTVDASLSYPWASGYPLRLQVTVSGNTVNLSKLESTGYVQKLSWVYSDLNTPGQVGLWSDGSTLFDDFTLNNTTTVIAQYFYDYDQNGNRTQVTDMQDHNTYYSYDSINSLIQEYHPDTPTYNLKYSYDSVGNRTLMINGNTTTSYAYNNLNQLTSMTTNGVAKTFTYDSNGNMTQKGSQSYTWNQENLLTQVGDAATYLYDALGQRVEKSNYDDGFNEINGKTENL